MSAPSGPEVEPPRILTEQTSVDYAETGEATDEVDRILVALADPDLERDDRAILEQELDNLAPQFQQGRRDAAEERQADRVVRVFATVDGDAVAQMTANAERLDALITEPDLPGALVAYHQGERVVIPAEVVVMMRSNFDRAFAGGARRARSTMESGFDAYRQQIEINDDQAVVSTIAGLLGGAENPIAAMSLQSVTVNQALNQLERAIAGHDYGTAARRLIEAETAARRIEMAANAFRDDHILGAERAVLGLEITSAVAFSVAASLSGGLAAAAVYSAAGGGAFATTAALGAGALTGGVTRGGLSGLGAGLDGQGDVGGRAWEGFKAGTIDGVVGAGGALVAPGVTNALATRFFGGPASTLSRGRALALNATSAAAIGAPSEAVATGLDLADDVVFGDLSLADYGLEVGQSGLIGGGLGAATSWVPINGLYRRGGLRVQPHTPRWMMEGVGHHPFQVNPDFAPTLNPLRMRAALGQRYGFNPTGPGFARFNSLPADQLPPLPGDHLWMRINGEWHPTSPSGTFGDGYSLHAQGGSYNLVAGGRANPQRLIQNTTRSRPTPTGEDRGLAAVKHFREVDAQGRTTARHGPGHNTPFADTPDPSLHPLEGTGTLPVGTRRDGTPVETLNQTTTNYTPEPYSSQNSAGHNVSDWGQHLRRQLEGEVRARGGGFRQINNRSTTGRVARGTRSRNSNSGVTLHDVPDSIVFVETDASGAAVQAWRVDFQNPPTARTLTAMDNAPLAGTANAPITRIPLADLPTATVGSTLRYVIPPGSAATYISEAVRVITDSR